MSEQPEKTDPGMTDPETTDAETTDAETTDAETTDAEMTDAEMTDAEMTNAENDAAAAGPDERPPHAEVLDSDANGNGPHGLAGDMGLSSERTGPMRGTDAPGTHGAEQTGPDAPGNAARQTDADGVPPEQSADPATGPEPQPDNDLPEHPFRAEDWQGHSHG